MSLLTELIWLQVTAFILVSAVLLYALRPYLKSERQEKVERALQLARLFYIGKKFLMERE